MSVDDKLNDIMKKNIYTFEKLFPILHHQNILKNKKK